VSTCFDASLSYAIVLSLERTGRVNNNVRAEPPQLRRKICGAAIQQCGLCEAACFIRDRPRLLQIATCNDDTTVTIGGERRYDLAPEVAVTTEY
jgi:hypothetical protein